MLEKLCKLFEEVETENKEFELLHDGVAWILNIWLYTDDDEELLHFDADEINELANKAFVALEKWYNDYRYSRALRNVL